MFEGLYYSTVKDGFIEAKYELFSTKQAQEVRNLEKNKIDVKLDHFDFDMLNGRISNEEVASLNKFKPKCLQTASKLPGIRPSSLMMISYLLRAKKIKL